MKTTRSNALFITIEGGDGAGKTLLIHRLEESLRARSLPLLITRNPGGTPIGEKIRDLILHQKEALSPRAELLLFLADRAHHVDTLLIPALEAGKIVLCDRFSDSTVAYQAAGRGLDISEIKKLCAFSAQSLTPDLTLYLDIDPASALQRIAKSKKDRLDREELAFHRAVRKAYLRLAEEESGRIRVLDASASPDTVFNQALALINELLAQKAVR